MFTYIILTHILSLIGLGIYWLLVRNKTSVYYSKLIVIGIVVLSLALPFTIDKLATSIDKAHPTCLHEHPVPEIIYTEYCPPEGDLERCYEIASNEAHFCNCDHVSIDNILLFKSNPTYDFILSNNSWFIGIAKGVAGLVLVLLLLKLSYLLFIISRSRKTSLVFKGKAYIVLHPRQKMSVSSFKLWHSYIVWQKELDFLSDIEREGVLWHEIAHLQQRDTWVKIAFHLLQTIWLINPVYYIIVKELDRLNEHLADDFAVHKIGDIKLYASVLVKMKRYEKLVLTQSFKTSALKKRVEHLITPSKIGQNVKGMLAIALVIAISLASTAYGTIIPLTNQLDKIKVYQNLNQQHENTGMSIFCKNCIINDTIIFPD